MIRKGRAAPGADRGSRRYGESGDSRDGDTAERGSLDPLDPASGYESPESSESSRTSRERETRSNRPTRSLKARALDYLSRREYSRTELSRKLAPFAEEGDSLDALIDTLEREGWLSDARFAESVVHRRAARMGANRIVSELRRHAVDDTLIEAVGAELRETEYSRAQAVWRKKFGELPQTPAERAKQARFLAMRGFSSATITKILKGDDDWGE
ncbi:recombination regulator RecX [Trinickia fusca]|uniref:Regulatory protein RecX n=1 Tax=Trinickia fusca TaxID=2419777 RepID=A0A494XG51_9BURK|nr:recombination regulator RecX [Trinickia fusca]